MQNPSLLTMFLAFLRLGAGAFGGPAMVVYIKALSVNKKHWLDEETFKDGVALCQSIPGATAMQVAAYVGLQVRGVMGALITYTGFGLPAFFLMLVLSSLYAGFHKLPQVISLFSGLQVIVVSIIVNATYSFGRGTLKDYRDIAIAITSTLLFWMGVNPFLVIIGVAATGILAFKNIHIVESKKIKQCGAFHVKQIAALLLALLISLPLIYLININLVKLATVMIKIDLFAFGGGFAALPLMLHEVVSTRGWMDGKTFMDGIALGQVTPGPIIITATFVGYMLYGLSGAIVSTISIFIPSFFMLLFAAPFFDRLKTSKYFFGTTRAILATFVGLLLYVAIKFALAIPWDVMRIAIGIASVIALLRKIDIFYVVLTGAFVSVLIIR
ncbi:MAG: chromate efflux transporter [Proteobacteria bacterium]|nr:chromate efflux transporter [Pseudomonadota bacterium]